MAKNVQGFYCWIALGNVENGRALSKHNLQLRFDSRRGR